MEQVISVVGTLCILSAFVAVQAGRIDTRGLMYLALNVAGSVVLSVVAVRDHQWGFLLLEGVWALVSTRSLIVALVADRGNGKHPDPARSSAP